MRSKPLLAMAICASLLLAACSRPTGGDGSSGARHRPSS